MMKLRKLYYSFLMLTFSLSLYGCSDGKSENIKDLQNFVATLKKEATVKSIPPADDKKPEFELPKPLTYEGSVPVFAQTSEQLENVANPLTAYPLQSYQFIGTIAQGPDIRAYVILPGGVAYPLKKGDVISNQYGKIVSIDTQRLQILVTDSKGSAELVTLQLKEQQRQVDQTSQDNSSKETP